MNKLTKSLAVLLFIGLLILSGCAPKSDEQEVVEDGAAGEARKSIVPSFQISDDEYKVVLPFKPSAARGVMTDRVTNRLDVSEMETGLKRHSTEVFDTNKYYFEEGQYLTKDMVEEWTSRKEVKKIKKEKIENEGLNPEISKDSENEADIKELKEKPRYLSHILEQNYLEHDGEKVELGGVSIGIAMKSVYRFQNEVGGPYYYEDISKKQAQEKGKAIAQKVVERMRERPGLEDVPIFVAVYREEEQSSVVPGNYIMKTSVKSGQTKIGEWENINERYVLFPSADADKNSVDDAEVIKSFSDDVSEYFPNFVGVVGEGFYKKDELQTLKIEIPIEFHGQSEIVGFTQYLYGVVQEKFPDHYDIEISVTSSNKIESMLMRKKGEEDPYVHIFQ